MGAHMNARTKIVLGVVLAGIGALAVVLSLLPGWAEAPRPLGVLLGFSLSTGYFAAGSHSAWHCGACRASRDVATPWQASERTDVGHGFLLSSLQGRRQEVHSTGRVKALVVRVTNRKLECVKVELKLPVFLPDSRHALRRMFVVAKVVCECVRRIGVWKAL